MNEGKNTHWPLMHLCRCTNACFFVFSYPMSHLIEMLKSNFNCPIDVHVVFCSVNHWLFDVDSFFWFRVLLFCVSLFFFFGIGTFLYLNDIITVQTNHNWEKMCWRERRGGFENDSINSHGECNVNVFSRFHLIVFNHTCLSSWLNFFVFFEGEVLPFD